MKNYLKKTITFATGCVLAGGLILGCADEDKYSDSVSMIFAKYKRNAVNKKISELKGDEHFFLNYAFNDKKITMKTNWSGTELTIKIIDSKTGNTLEMADETNGMYAEVRDKPNSGRYYFGGIDKIIVNGEFLPMQKLSKEDLNDLEKRFDDAAVMILERYENSVDEKVKNALKLIDDTKISQEAK